MVETTKLYINDTYLFECTAAILSIEEIGNGPVPSGAKGCTHKMCFDQTVFHPQGGGQPSDVGGVYNMDSVLIFNVRFVSTSGSGIVEHYGLMNGEVDQVMQQITSLIESGDKAACSLKIDSEIRMRNARLHSAGHALDAALNRCSNDIGNKLLPTKGYHFSDGCYVEYTVKDGVNLTDKDVEALPAELNAKLEEIIAENIATQIEYVDKARAQEMCPDMNLANYPFDVVRVVTVAGLACPCGGTHVKSTSDLGKITVTKIKIKKGVCKIQYTVS